MTKLKELSVLEYESRYGDSSLPEYARHYKKFSDSSANALTKSIIAWIQLHGGMAERINTMGVPVDKRKVVTNCIGQSQQIGSVEWRRGGGTRGSADISAVVQGRTLKIEIKHGRDKQSEAQKEYQRMVENAGGLYWIVRTFDEFVGMYNGLTETT